MFEKRKDLRDVSAEQRQAPREQNTSDAPLTRRSRSEAPQARASEPAAPQRPAQQARPAEKPVNKEQPMAQKKKKKAGNRKKIITICAAAAVVVAVAGVGVFGFLSGWFDKEPDLFMLDDGLVAAGVSVEGVQVGGDAPKDALTKLEALVAESQEAIVLPIVIADRTEEVPISQLGVGTSGEDALGIAMAVGRSGGIEDRRKQIADARQSGMDCELKFDYDENTIREAVIAYCDAVPREPTKEEVKFDPSLPERFTFTERKAGFIPDTNQFASMVLERVRNWDFSAITMPGEAIEPDGASTGVIENTVLIAKHSTSFSGSSYGRAYNIKLGLSKINGKIVQPGETFSVEDNLGNTTDGRVWKSAGAIENGVPTDQVGGGICQVSTTLFNAVVRSDLKIDEWWFHSILSSYTPIGTDAALNYGTADFRFTNNTEWPIYIVAYTQGTKAYCEIWGRPIPDGGSIDIVGVRTGTIPQPKDIEVTNEKDVSGGRMGHRCTTYKIYKDKDGKEIKRV
ncbi:MAG: hypothetical protein E7328_01570, partial [Clostridiales bacterium]|nr:hypothetical protein [Clostridiales bacterium]